jgi:integrase
MALTDTACRNAKPKEKPYKLADVEGVYLLVSPAGGKYWKWKYRFLGKEKKLALGSYPASGLSDARGRRLAAQKLLEVGIDPSEQKKLEIAEKTKVSANTFQLVALEWHTQNLGGWTKRHADYVLRRLNHDIFPMLGKRPVAEITPKELIDVLRQVEDRGAQELARRLKQTCGQIFRYAIIHEKATTNPAAAFFNKDALKPFTKGHYAALESREISGFMAALGRNDARLYPATRYALKLMMLTFVRTSELIEARWSEFDLDGAQWLIPAERMKMRRPHIVPLCAQALVILRELESQRAKWGTEAVPDFVFPNQVNPRKAMSNNTILKAIERLGYKGQTTGHGFRAMAMSTIKEKLGYRHEVVDRQLAHAPSNKVDAAYDRAMFIDERRVMMQAWGDYLEAQAKGNVVEFRRVG